MVNQTILIGKLIGEPVTTTEEDKKITYITIAVKRRFTNENDIFEEDIIPIQLWNNLAEETFNNCHNGDLIGIKGRLQTIDDRITIIAEKVTFLSNKKEENK